MEKYYECKYSSLITSIFGIVEAAYKNKDLDEVKKKLLHLVFGYMESECWKDEDFMNQFFSWMREEE